MSLREGMDYVEVPFVIRGEIVDNCILQFDGRKGGISFTTPDIQRYLNQLLDLDPVAMAEFQEVRIEEVARFLDEVGSRLDFDSNAYMQAAFRLSAITSGMTASILETTYRNFGRRFFARDNVIEYVEQRIGAQYLEGWVPTKLRDGTTSAIRAFGSRCVHVIAGNSPGVAFNTILRSAVTRSDSIIKTPSNDPLTSAAILQTMIEIDAKHPVTRHLSSVYWKGGDERIEARLYHPDHLEKVVAWGGFDSIKHITRYLQPGLDLITMDPKHSISVIGADVFANDETMRAVARRAACDMGAYNQELCANARVIYVECDAEDDAQRQQLERFGSYVYESLQALPTTLSTAAKYVVPALQEELEGMAMFPEFYSLYRDDDRSGAVIVSKLEDVVSFAGLLGCRTANIVPVNSIDEIIKRVNSSTQTVGVYPEALKERIRNALSLRGAQIIIKLGYVARINGNGPMDGIEPERRMLKWVVDQSQDESLTPPWEPLMPWTNSGCGQTQR
ncbi:MAG: acyl-CoA reductase [Spongiibacteraceae bacterium]